MSRRTADKRGDGFVQTARVRASVRARVSTAITLVMALVTALCLLALARPASAANTDDEGTRNIPPGLEDVGVKEHLDGPLPMDAQFRDHTGKPVRFGDLFDGKRPVLLTLAYHT